MEIYNYICDWNWSEVAMDCAINCFDCYSSPWFLVWLAHSVRQYHLNIQGRSKHIIQSKNGWLN